MIKDIIFGLLSSADMIFYIMISFSFVIGIILMVSPEAFESLNRALNREYGIKIKLIPKWEESVHFVDKAVIKHRTIAGIVITAAAFVLLLIFR